jgi:hypothetical protein
MGCETCRAWHLNRPGSQPASDCTDAFREIDSYFSATLTRCADCGQVWLAGYHEDLSNRPLDEDFGDRTWMLRPLTAAQLAEIDAARGIRRLELDTFAGTEVWVSPAG